MGLREKVGATSAREVVLVFERKGPKTTDFLLHDRTQSHQEQAVQPAVDPRPARLDNASFRMFSNDFKRTPEAQQLLDAVGEQALHGRTVQDALRRNVTGAVAPDA